MLTVWPTLLRLPVVCREGRYDGGAASPTSVCALSSLLPLPYIPFPDLPFVIDVHTASRNGCESAVNPRTVSVI